MMNDAQAAGRGVLVGGLVTVDVLVRPVPLDKPIGAGRLIAVDPIEVATGGVVANCGAAVARLGVPVAAIAAVGDDLWADWVERRLTAASISPRLERDPASATPVSIVTIDSGGERSFLFSAGAAERLDVQRLAGERSLFESAEWLIWGYYSLFPAVDAGLADLFRAARRAGCRVALDAAGDGGGADPLRDLLPLVDVYLPSFDEGVHQTGCHDPQAIIDVYRGWGAAGIVGVKLGARGARISPAQNRVLDLPPIDCGLPVVDTTGAGDSLLGGLIAGLARGLGIDEACRVGAACASFCTSACGASTGLRGWDETLRLAREGRPRVPPHAAAPP